MLKLAERIQKNNQKTSKENILKVLNSSKKKEKNKSPLEKSDHEKSFLSNSENTINPLPYTKNFKKKKLEDMNTSFPLKKIKYNENSNSNSFHISNNQVISQKQTFKSKRRFLINKEKDEIQLSQNQNEKNFLFTGKENEPEDPKKDMCTQEKNSGFISNDTNPFRQNFRKKEERKGLSGFSCDQCEKVLFYILNKYIMSISFIKL